MFLFSYVQICSLFMGGIIVILAAATHDKIKLEYRHLTLLFGFGLVGAIAASGQQSVWYDQLEFRMNVMPNDAYRLQAQIRVMERNAERQRYLFEEKRKQPVPAVVSRPFRNFLAYDLQSPGDLYEYTNTCPQPRNASVVDFLLHRPWGTP